MEFSRNQRQIIKIFAAVLLLGLFISGNIAVFALTYIFVYLVMVARAVMTTGKKRMRFFLFLAYSVMLALQLTYMGLVIFGDHYDHLATEYAARLFGTLLVVFPWAIEKIFTSRKQTEFIMPSVQELSTISMNELKENR